MRLLPSRSQSFPPTTQVPQTRPLTTNSAADGSSDQQAVPTVLSPNPRRLNQAESSVRQLGRKTKFVNIPAALVDQIAGNLSARDISSMSQLDRATKENVQERLGSLQFIDDISRVETLGELRGSLQRIKAVVPDLRSESLHLAMLRVNHLPIDVRDQALADLEPELGEMSDVSLPWRDSIVQHPDARTAVTAGEHVGLAASCFGITTDAGIHDLELLALDRTDPNSVKSLVGNGASVQRIAQRCGIVTKFGISKVQNLVFENTGPNSAQTAVRNGGIPLEVADTYGINTPRHLSLLMQITLRSRHPNSAGGAVDNGASVQDVVMRFGITDFDDLFALENVAARRAHRT